MSKNKQYEEQKSKGWIPVYRAMFDDREGKNHLHLSPEEFSMYVAIARRRAMASKDIELEYTKIAENVGLAYRSTTKQKIQELLYQLQDKGIIQIIEITKQLSTVRINEIVLSSIKEIGLAGGFYKLEEDELKVVLESTKNNSRLLYSYMMIRARGTNHRILNFSYVLWSDLLGVSRNTAIKTLKELEATGLIDVNRVKMSYTQNEINQYSIPENAKFTFDDSHKSHEFQNKVLNKLRQSIQEVTPYEEVELIHEDLDDLDNHKHESAEERINRIF